MENNNPSSSRADRKTMERNRRNQMKFLFSRLYSLVPHQTSRDSVPFPDQLDEATRYIKKLQINVERLKEKRDNLLGVESLNCRILSSGMDIMRTEPVSPRIDIHKTGSGLEINLVTGSSCHQSMFNKVTRVLNEEGVEIVNASFSAVGGVAYHTIHAYKDHGERSSNTADARISKRLMKIVHGGDD